MALPLNIARRVWGGDSYGSISPPLLLLAMRCIKALWITGSSNCQLPFYLFRSHLSNLSLYGWKGVRTRYGKCGTLKIYDVYDGDKYGGLMNVVGIAPISGGRPGYRSRLLLQRHIVFALDFSHECGIVFASATASMSSHIVFFLLSAVWLR